MNIEALPGAIAPFGFFDPLNISQGKSDAVITRFREAEVKHGRFAMLAALGILVGEAAELASVLLCSAKKLLVP